MLLYTSYQMIRNDATVALVCGCLYQRGPSKLKKKNRVGNPWDAQSLGPEKLTAGQLRSLARFRQLWTVPTATAAATALLQAAAGPFLQAQGGLTIAKQKWREVGRFEAYVFTHALTYVYRKKVFTLLGKPWQLGNHGADEWPYTTPSLRHRMVRRFHFKSPVMSEFRMIYNEMIWYIDLLGTCASTFELIFSLDVREWPTFTEDHPNI